MLFITVWLGMSDLSMSILMFSKNKEGLRAMVKIVAQVIAGVVVGLTISFSSDIVVREKVLRRSGYSYHHDNTGR
jgi:phospho-N-acetylmuramoyl-pentapeptide-transferase